MDTTGDQQQNKRPARRGARTRLTAASAAAVLVCLCAVAASAEVLLTKVNANGREFPGGCHPDENSIIVDFNDIESSNPPPQCTTVPGGQVFNFTTTRPSTRVLITFYAECKILNSGTLDFIDIDIEVDRAGGSVLFQDLPPTEGSQALCSGQGSRAGVGAVAAGTDTFGPGTHQVMVRARLVRSGAVTDTTGALDDMTLVVQR